MILISPAAASQLRLMLAERCAGMDPSPASPAVGTAASPAVGTAAYLNSNASVVSAEAPGSVLERASGESVVVDGLRIVVEKGGCAGMQYEMHFDAARPGDEVSESEGARVFVDVASARFLEGSTLDYFDDLVGTGFRLQNPRAARSCRAAPAASWKLLQFLPVTKRRRVILPSPAGSTMC
jgi:iron-sulfur cluster assembly accessory protein